MAVPEGGMQPLIGYAMQALGHPGATDLSVQAQMERIAGERGWPTRLIPQAINQARLNREATLAARESGSPVKLGDLFGGPEVAPTTVGVRVVFVVVVDVPGMPVHSETVSVIVNVSPDWNALQALDAAALLWQRTMSRSRYGSGEIDLDNSPGIVAMFEGGYEGAEYIV